MTQRAIDEIKRLYHRTTADTIERDLKRAVTILKTLPDEETRARAAVYMDGLSQMRSEWRLKPRRAAGKLTKRKTERKRPEK